jgi:mannose-1-phosphate guanylyltransferase
LDIGRLTKSVERRTYGNAGIIASRVDILQEELARVQPDLLSLTQQFTGDWRNYDVERVSYFLWSPLTSSSIERDVLERARRVAVVPPD